MYLAAVKKRFLPRGVNTGGPCCADPSEDWDPTMSTRRSSELITSPPESRFHPITHNAPLETQRFLMAPVKRGGFDLVLLRVKNPHSGRLLLI